MVIRDHRGPLELDLRRLGCALGDVGRTMPLDEAARIVALLVRDPSTNVGAAANGWTHPASAAELILMDLYDGLMRAHFTNPQPYPRPWVTKGNQQRIGNGTTLSREEVRDLLARRRNGEG